MNDGYDILMKFSYDDRDYIIFTDYTYDEEGILNFYGSGIDSEGRLVEVEDVDMDKVFQIKIDEYKDKLLRGEV